MSKSHRSALSQLFLATVLALGFALPARAGGTVSLTAAKVDDQVGAELALGYLTGNHVAYAGGSLGVFTYSQPDGRYHMYSQSNGERCRDTSNGQYVKKELCDKSAYDAFATVEGGFRLGTNATVGIGARFSREVQPYAGLNVAVSRYVLFRLAAGKGYSSVGVAYAF